MPSRAGLEKLAIAPVNLRETLVRLIEEEMAHARAGPQGADLGQAQLAGRRPDHQKLYEASQAGVKIDLVIRGICCLRPGRARRSPRTSGSRASSAASSSMRGSSASAPGTGCPREGARSSSPRPTGCRATCRAGSRPWCRSRTRPCTSRSCRQVMAANLKDMANSWILQRGRQLRAPRARRGGASRRTSTS